MHNVMNQDSNAQDWYSNVANNAERNKFYEIFFSACNTYNIKWATATPKEKAFIEAFTNFTYSRWQSKTEEEKATIQPMFLI